MWTDVRGNDGAFLGMCDVIVPPEHRHVHLVVESTFNPAAAVAITPIFCDQITLHRERWRDGDQIRSVWRVDDDDAPKLSRVKRVHVVGATCETKFGRQARLSEMCRRIAAMLYFHRVPASRLTVQ